MNKYHTEQTSRTLGTVMVAGMLASTFLPSDYNNELSLSRPHFSPSNNYTFASHGTSSTYETNKNILTGHYPSSEKTIFEAVVTSFFKELTLNQEPLDREFEQVLFENLWDLYQS
jgi:hypothetical protein